VSPLRKVPIHLTAIEKEAYPLGLSILMLKINQNKLFKSWRQLMLKNIQARKRKPIQECTSIKVQTIFLQNFWRPWVPRRSLQKQFQVEMIIFGRGHVAR